MKLIGFVGDSGSGKTTLIEKLLPCLLQAGLAVAVLKHTHHDFDVDQPGKDSWRFRQAGAQQVLLAGGQRWVLMHEGPPPELADLLARLAPCDVVLVEGFKAAAMPKILVHRQIQGAPQWRPSWQGGVAVATDGEESGGLPRLDINDAAAVAHFVMNYLGLEA